MSKWPKVLIQVGTLAIATLVVGQFEQPVQASRLITMDYNGLSWTATTAATDVAELLVEYFGSYETLQVDPLPDTQLATMMTVWIQDATLTKLDATVAKNYKIQQTALATVATPPKPKLSELHSGLATWYRFGDKLTAASRKYPKGTKLRVVAVNSGKSVDVVINDYGPSAFTGIDLDLNEPAFAAIAPLGAGKIKVKYYKI
ncbi:MAG: septal ring lytic transglycosylase RlpA family protein [Patescibacteria group bacterium]|jgi:rare lipoprotein A (peptidoglycan hydrolase)